MHRRQQSVSSQRFADRRPLQLRVNRESGAANYEPLSWYWPGGNWSKGAEAAQNNQEKEEIEAFILQQKKPANLVREPRRLSPSQTGSTILVQINAPRFWIMRKEGIQSLRKIAHKVGLWTPINVHFQKPFNFYWSFWFKWKTDWARESDQIEHVYK